MVGCFWPCPAAGDERQQSLLPGFVASEPFDEQVRWVRLESGVKVFTNARRTLSEKPRRLVLFATANGNTIEQTLGCASGPGIDWHYQIQHVAAQIRALRDIDLEHEWILAVVQAPKLSWPLFRKNNPAAGASVLSIVQSLLDDSGAADVVLSGHSGGGAFLWEYIATAKLIPPKITRIVFLDANYSYSDQAGHGESLVTWLKESSDRHLIVVAYDDREIELNGRKVVEADGGTWRASERMLTRLRHDVKVVEEDLGPLRHIGGLDGQLQFLMHRNPENRILHTALVGDMNGVLHSLTVGTPLEGKWGQFTDPPVYDRWIQEQPFVERQTDQSSVEAVADSRSLRCPLRSPGALNGAMFGNEIRDLPRVERESAIVRELLAGNLPDRLRKLVPIHLRSSDGNEVRHSGIVFVTSDYLSIGSDEDSLRLPLSPGSALQVADAFGASLITTKISDDIFSAATARLEPRPLTKNRESVDSFVEHNQIIETQLIDRPDRTLVAGIKKDIVISNVLSLKPHRVAIYGWHQANGSPIQNLYSGHVDWYVDYSHGIRLISNDIIVDGRIMSIADVLRDTDLCGLLSSEGVLDLAALRRSAQW